jgi:hypothetical protein
MAVEDILTVDGSLWTNMGRCYTEIILYQRDWQGSNLLVTTTHMESSIR